MYIHVHTCSAIPVPEKNDTEFGDDNNDMMAFNTLVREYKQTYMGTRVTTLSSSWTVLSITLTFVNSLGLYLVVLTSLISGKALHRDKQWHKSIHTYVNTCNCYKLIKLLSVRQIGHFS